MRRVLFFAVLLLVVCGCRKAENQPNIKEVEKTTDSDASTNGVAGTKVPQDGRDELIQFQDLEVKRILINMDGVDKNSDGEISYREASEVTDIGEVFKEKKIKTFDEFQYFTSIWEIKEDAFKIVLT